MSLTDDRINEIYAEHHCSAPLAVARAIEQEVVIEEATKLSKFLNETESNEPFVMKEVLGKQEPVAIVERRFVHGAWCCFINKTPTTIDLPDGTLLFANLHQPRVVSSDANPDEMNELYGEAYGVDWVYPTSPQPCPKCAEWQNKFLMEQAVNAGDHVLLSENAKLIAKCAELEAKLAAASDDSGAVAWMSKDEEGVRFGQSDYFCVPLFLRKGQP